jgi:hypothetical protein
MQPELTALADARQLVEFLARLDRKQLKELPPTCAEGDLRDAMCVLGRGPIRDRPAKLLKAFGRGDAAIDELSIAVASLEVRHGEERGWARLPSRQCAS